MQAIHNRIQELLPYQYNLRKPIPYRLATGEAILTSAIYNTGQQGRNKAVGTIDYGQNTIFILVYNNETHFIDAKLRVPDYSYKSQKEVYTSLHYELSDPELLDKLQKDITTYFSNKQTDNDS